MMQEIFFFLKKNNLIKNKSESNLEVTKTVIEIKINELECE